uniref:DDE-1 domain-containing protein n=1 Tax=Timema poppense TaxID=170557 RepID=A0A7R9DIM4_TIMPO|nr:unnamed protein product [Timema poppensis]
MDCYPQAPSLEVAVECGATWTQWTAILKRHLLRYKIMSDNVKKRGLWTEEDMYKAVSGVNSGKFSVQGASNQLCVPRRTLRRYLEKDGPLKKSKLGGKPLTPGQEKQLCQRIFRFSSVGYPLTPNILKLNVFRFCQENNIPNSFKESAGRSITTQTFVDFLQHFARFKTNGPCLLIFDGAKAHLDYKFCEEAEKHGIAIYCLPSNTTHELQPLDKSCFRSFETFWDQEVLRFFDSHRDQNDITRLNFPDVFTPAWGKSMTQSNMTSGFRATGMYPFNPNVIPEEAFAPSTVTKLPLTELNNQQSSGLPDNNQPSTSSDPIPSCSSLDQSTTLLASVAHTSPQQTKGAKRPRLVDLDSSSSSDIDYPIDVVAICMDGEDSPPGIQSSSFDEFLPMPKRKRKTSRVIIPAMNSRGIELKRNLFQPKEYQASKPKKKPTTKQPLTNKPKTKQQQPRKKRTQKTTEAESWYCSVCEEDEVKDMRLCVVCGNFYHEECVGLTAVYPMTLGFTGSSTHGPWGKPCVSYGRLFQRCMGCAPPPINWGGNVKLLSLTASLGVTGGCHDDGDVVFRHVWVGVGKRSAIVFRLR